ncbi:hypothetical protein LX97_02099 [Nonlabens dokdonensis]|jgi:hypothetical protein|uniref:Uncharacterized protein n=2 Tax=Nonlabens dokdonensis TaxID=328515 RepID=L7WCR0_NONDD|nr:hypothetical protein [Nonlabens dokdonensis]AGC77721.1 hypothetical protein DDD_2594 [Nonlabens dokdonensis DSW-6]PZX39742.1 hypothetical protein LX97_02099 [Nonlabens dokdonensis]
MLEIFLIIYLSKKIGAILESKGYKKGWYIALFVFTWITGELGGFVIGALVFPEQPIAMYIIALLGAAAAFAANFYFAKSLPNKNMHDLDQFGMTEEFNA